MSRLLVRGGRVIDPGTGRATGSPTCWSSRRLVSIARESTRRERPSDAYRKVVFRVQISTCPARPVQYKESILSGAPGGRRGRVLRRLRDAEHRSGHMIYRTVTRWITDRAREIGIARVYLIGAITKGMRGEELSEFGEMKEAGAVAFSDDGRWVANGSVMLAGARVRAALRPPGRHARRGRDPLRPGSDERGAVSTRLGLSAQPSEAESIAIARDLALCELASGRLHVCQRLDGALGLPDPRGESAGCPGDGGGDAASPLPHRRGSFPIVVLHPHER